MHRGVGITISVTHGGVRHKKTCQNLAFHRGCGDKKWNDPMLHQIFRDCYGLLWSRVSICVVSIKVFQSALVTSRKIHLTLKQDYPASRGPRLKGLCSQRIIKT